MRAVARGGAGWLGVARGGWGWRAVAGEGGGSEWRAVARCGQQFVGWLGVARGGWGLGALALPGCSCAFWVLLRFPGAPALSGCSLGRPLGIKNVLAKTFFEAQVTSEAKAVLRPS